MPAGTALIFLFFHKYWPGLWLDDFLYWRYSIRLFLSFENDLKFFSAINFDDRRPNCHDEALHIKWAVLNRSWNYVFWYAFCIILFFGVGELTRNSFKVLRDQKRSFQNWAKNSWENLTFPFKCIWNVFSFEIHISWVCE